ncbi:META domain-containing protein [Barnesiella sp. WM24]|uniref:META domain-containing protein n=1 Tax=Barnesiella sp. WM24 TaxID=2558278 RepID=UPI001071AEED|nr:META domain-containing protein [Barnesiella sp. WM24]TFU94409.1 META domain-containing protein [Barnesiella sp. WM24]
MTRKSILSVATALTILTASCGGNKGNKEAADNQQKETVANVDVHGQWYLDSIVFSDSDYVRPSEEVPRVLQYIVFEDSTYFIQTNCNTFSGSYTVVGDSITLGDGVMTEKACDNMATEDAIRRILPNIATVYIQNDSIARLDSHNPSEYIVLCKAPIEIKRKN